MEVTKETIIGDIIDFDEDCSEIFLEAGMHCLDCPVSRSECIEDACDVHGIAIRLDDVPVALLRCGKAAPVLRSTHHNRRLSLRPLRDDRQRLAENALQKEIQFIRREPRRIRRVIRQDDLRTAIDDYIGMRRGVSRKERKERKEDTTGRRHHNP